MLAAFDLDGTLLRKNCSFAFCRFLCKMGVLNQLDLLYCLTSYLRHSYLGLSLWDLHHLMFQRLFFKRKICDLYPYLEQFLAEKLEKLWYDPVVERLGTLQNKGAECIILSSSPRFLVFPIAQKLGIEKVFATEYLHNEQGELTAIASMMDGQRKADILHQLMPSNPVIAFSDSILDLPFLEKAQYAVAVNPKRKLKKIAQRENWEIL